MDGDLRTLLRDRAGEVRPDPRMPATVLRRSRRRRLATGMLAGALTVGATAGVFAGARVLLEEKAPQPREARSTGSPAEFYPYIFPTREELAITMTEVKEGSFLPASPHGTALLFAMNVLGWEEEDVEVDVRGDDPITAIITNPTLNESAEATADLRTAVYLAQVPGSHDPPVYAVLAAQAEDMELEPVGPDEQFGTGGTIGFRGRVGFVPEAGAVVLLVDGEEGTSAAPTPNGRFKVEASISGGIGPAALLSVALTDSAGRTLALTSSRVAMPVAGESEGQASAPVQVAPPQEVPPAVLDTRQGILDAAQARDWGALRALIPGQGFTFSFGGERDPIAYWRKLESVDHVPVLGDILPVVLSTEPGRFRGAYIWPAQAAEDPAEWDERDLDVLRQIHNEEDIRLFRKIGLYTGWRVEIAADGTWLSFVAGD
jgi:hypothetical protein